MDEATEISLKDQFNSLLVQAIENRRGGMALMRVLEELDFYNSPASAKHHLNVPGGLVLHAKHNEFKTKEQRDNAFTVSIHRRNDMQDGLDNLYRRYVLPAPISDLMEIPYRAEQVWLVIRHALAWHDKPEGDWMNVEFDKPLNRSDQPQPTIKLTEVQDNTKPACDG